MAITLKKGTKKVEEQPAAQTQANAPEPVPAEVPTTELTYLPEEIREQVLALPEGVKGHFISANELTPALLETVMPDLPETLTEALLGLLENEMNEALPNAEPAPAQEVMAQAPAAVTEDASRQAKRDALKAQIAAGASTPIPAKAVKQPDTSAKEPALKAAPAEAVVAPVSLGAWDSLFPVGQAVTIINRGGGRFELHVGAVKAMPAEKAQAEAPAAKKEKKVKVTSISNNPAYWTQEYKDFLAEMKEKYTDLDSRIKFAESLGMVRGTDWADKTKDGNPQHPAIENMQLMNAIREKKGIAIYIPEADTSEKRRALAHGNS